MTLFDREPLFARLHELGAGQWADDLRSQCDLAWQPHSHGMLPTWIAAWQQLPTGAGCVLQASSGTVTVSSTSSPVDDTLRHTLMQFHPWRKGPFEILGTFIDTEWRSDWKWARIQPHVDLHGHCVLDTGCGNGYYGWRILDAGAKLVCGLDPFLLYVMQYEVVRRYADRSQHNYVLPVSDDALRMAPRLFDTAFSMGVLYHRTSPIEHLQMLHGALRRGGQLVLETLIIEDENVQVLVPEDRYAQMRNVWFIPTVGLLKRWLRRTGFRDITTLDITATTSDEQRRTDWMTFDSLSNFLSPDDPERTIEGYPGPRRAILLARKL